jgi:hypothetical protein
MKLHTIKQLEITDVKLPTINAAYLYNNDLDACWGYCIRYGVITYDERFNTYRETSIDCENKSYFFELNNGNVISVIQHKLK